MNTYYAQKNVSKNECMYLVTQSITNIKTSV